MPEAEVWKELEDETRQVAPWVCSCSGCAPVARRSGVRATSEAFSRLTVSHVYPLLQTQQHRSSPALISSREASTSYLPAHTSPFSPPFSGNGFPTHPDSTHPQGRDLCGTELSPEPRSGEGAVPSERHRPRGTVAWQNASSRSV